MYHPTTRLLTMLELLQARSVVQGTELARRLEVDARSVRRYILMLQQMGIPIEGTRGPAGGYRLRPGYKLPPLMFTQEEALAVTLGLAGIHWLQVALPALAVDGALGKVYRALPAHLRERAQTLSRHLSLDRQLGDEIPSLSLLVTLSEAIEACHHLLVVYRSRTQATTERQVSPYGVVGWAGHWYLVGYCQLRQALRVFRLDRLQTVEVLSSSFARPEQIDCLALVLESVASMPGAWLIEVEFQATLEAVQHKVSATSHHLEPSEGGVLYRCHFDDLEEFARYLVGLGLPFVVRRPPALALVLQELAAALLRAATPLQGEEEC